ncbi:MAG: aminotransferase class V-fold PLP-dependent enzyme [Gemmatimonadales bacterium]
MSHRPGAALASEFGLGGGVYLNHAASGPLPARSAAALERYVRNRLDPTALYQAGAQDYDPNALRGKLGRLLNAPPERIGFVPTTSDGIAGLLNGIPWRRGDRIVYAEGEYPSVVYAALALEARGVRPVAVPMPPGRLDLDRLLDAVDERTRAVAASFVNWQTGWRIDLARLGAGCRSQGALSIVDAIQGMGVSPIDLAGSGVDAVVAGTYKWLLGVPGLAVLGASERLLEEVTPDRAGWVSVATSVYAEPAFVWGEGARRFSVGAPADPALIALEPSVDLLLEVGLDRIAPYTEALAMAIGDGASALGLTVNSSAEPSTRSAIASITTGSPDRDARLVAELVSRGIVVARRGPGIRVSPHLHNTPSHVDRLVETLRALLD